MPQAKAKGENKLFLEKQRGPRFASNRQVSACALYISNMASGAVLPTYQRYQSGIPIQNRRSGMLRMREKYIVLLVFVTFLIFCFGTFFFLPDLRDRVSVNHLKRQLGSDIFLPKQSEGDGGKILRHHPNELVDAHHIQDKAAINQRIKDANLDIPKDEQVVLKKEVEEEKEKFLKKLQEEEDKKKAEEHYSKLQVKQDHVEEPVKSNNKSDTSNKDPDTENVQRREKVKQVRPYDDSVLVNPHTVYDQNDPSFKLPFHSK